MAKDKKVTAKVTTKVDTKDVTIAQALNELKLLDKKITKKIQNSVFVGVEVAGKVRDNFDFENASASLQSVNDLMARRELIKGAINASNFKTKVKVAGKSYTVAEAIITKDTMKYKTRLFESMSRDFRSATTNVQMLADEVQENLEQQLKGIEDKAKIKEFSETYVGLRVPALSDPIGVGVYLEALENEIYDFENEVDYILSTSNATTTIKI